MSAKYTDITDDLDAESRTRVATTKCPTCGSPTLIVAEKVVVRAEPLGAFAQAGISPKLAFEELTGIVLKCVAPDCDYEEAPSP